MSYQTAVRFNHLDHLSQNDLEYIEKKVEELLVSENIRGEVIDVRQRKFSDEPEGTPVSELQGLAP